VSQDPLLLLVILYCQKLKRTQRATAGLAFFREGNVAINTKIKVLCPKSKSKRSSEALLRDRWEDEEGPAGGGMLDTPTFMSDVVRWVKMTLQGKMPRYGKGAGLKRGAGTISHSIGRELA
jgi:hypothetical protein